MSLQKEWQLWVVGTLVAFIVGLIGVVANSYADEQHKLSAKQERIQEELAKRSTDIEVLKVEMRNQTELMRSMNLVLQQLVRKK